MDEFDSAEMAGGQAVGFNGEMHGFNADAEARLADALMDVGRWVEKEAGALMGHIKMAVVSDDGSVTMSLTDLKEGVMYHGRLRPCRNAEFSFMAAVLDVDGDELAHIAMHALEDSGVDMHIEGHSRHHHHHDGECSYGHHHEHGEKCSCGHHHEHHHHDDECSCGHHHHDDDCGCGHHHHD